MSTTPPPYPKPRRFDLESMLLIASLAMLAGGLGALVAGPLGAVFAMGLGLAGAHSTRNLSPQATLKMMRARPLRPYEAPALYQTVRGLARSAGLSHAPRLYLLPSLAPNALTVGSGSQAAIAVTRGLLTQLQAHQLRGVLAHEISHIAHRDTTLMAWASSFAQVSQSLQQIGGWFVLLSLWDPRFLLLSAALIAGPTLALSTLSVLSRRREFAADASAARLTGDPEGLAHALLQIAPPRAWRDRLRPNVSHPATADRVERLRAMAPPQRHAYPIPSLLPRRVARQSSSAKR